MPANRTIWVIAEGKTEQAARHHLKAFIDGRAGENPKVRLHVLSMNGPLTRASVRKQAETALSHPSTIGLVALTDVYPSFTSASHARAVVTDWLPKDPRCHAHVACHDFEAWLLVGWSALLKQAGIAKQKPWGKHPEAINTDKPPAHRIKALFQRAERSYSRVVDGKKLFEKLDLEQVAALCREFKAFVNCLLSLSGYPLVP
jgi:hypothetical protein